MATEPTLPNPALALPPTDAIGRQRRLLRDRERKVFSQFNEDGILEFLFLRLGLGSKQFVEFGVGNGRECNTANLSLNHGWTGLLLEGNPTDIARAGAYYGNNRTLQPGQVKVVEAFINAENINTLIASNLPALSSGVRLDLLSIDIDGNDAWVWRAITAVRPRVVVIEYNAIYGYERSITIPYDPAFERLRAHPSGLYCGASLAALKRIGLEKGYALVGCESHGVNAFFVDRELMAAAGLVEVPPERAYYPHTWWTDRFGQTEQQFKWVDQMEYAAI